MHAICVPVGDVMGIKTVTVYSCNTCGKTDAKSGWTFSQVHIPERAGPSLDDGSEWLAIQEETPFFCSFDCMATFLVQKRNAKVASIAVDGERGRSLRSACGSLDEHNPHWFHRFGCRERRCEGTRWTWSAPCGNQEEHQQHRYFKETSDITGLWCGGVCKCNSVGSGVPHSQGEHK